MDDIRNKLTDLMTGVGKAWAGESQKMMKAGGGVVPYLANKAVENYIYDPVTKKVAPYFQDVTVPALNEPIAQLPNESRDQYIERQARSVSKMAPMMMSLNTAPQITRNLAPNGIDINNVLQNRINSLDEIKANPTSRFAKEAEKYLEKSANWMQKNGFGEYLEDPRYAYKMDPLTQKVIPNKQAVDPLIEEARKYKTFEDFKKNNVIEIPIDPKKTYGGIANDSTDPFSWDKNTGTSNTGPIRIKHTVEDGTRTIIDGNTRLRQAIERGEKTIKAHIEFWKDDFGKNFWKKAQGSK